jgi:CRP-like cAMP-binding protein
VADKTHPLTESALARLFLDPEITGEAVAFSLPGGATLYESGEAADHLYFVRAGRLAAIRHEEGMDPHFLGIIRPGEPVGEMAITRQGLSPCAIPKSWPCPGLRFFRRRTGTPGLWSSWPD